MDVISVTTTREGTFPVRFAFLLWLVYEIEWLVPSSEIVQNTDCCKRVKKKC